MSTSISEDDADPLKRFSLNPILISLWNSRDVLIQAVGRKCYDEELVEWAVTEAFIVLFLGQAETSLPFMHQYQVRAWLIRAALYVVLKELRKRRRWAELYEKQSTSASSGWDSLSGSTISLETR